MPEIQIEEERVLIANRMPPGDNWELVIDQGTTIESLVMALTMYMRKTKFKGSYQLDPLDGKLYAIEKQEVEVVDRRAGLSKQDTEYIGSISDLIPQDRPMERSSAMRGGMGSSGMQRSSVGGGKKGSLGLGAINDDDEEDSD